MIERWQAQVAAPEVYALGEGPVWDGPRDRLLWVDILAGTVHTGRLDGGGVVHTGAHHVDRYAGAIAPGRTGEILVAGAESLLVLGDQGEITPGPRILPPGTGRRLNDGACDPDGVFLIGTLELDDKPGGEALFRVGADRSVTVIDDGLSLANGLGWSPDGRLFYSIDTLAGVVYVRDYPGGGRREFVRPDGPPDGMRVDAGGNLWIAIFGGGEVRRYSPAGELTGVVEVGPPNVTCMAFAGPALDRLIITTATKDDSSGHPDAGKLFIADVGATGLPVTPWAGFTS